MYGGGTETDMGRLQKCTCAVLAKWMYGFLQLLTFHVYLLFPRLITVHLLYMFDISQNNYFHSQFE